MGIVSSFEQLTGHTPLLRASRLEAAWNVKAHLLLKLECMNPAGSAKDRVAVAILDDAEKRGVLLPGGTVIEETSGNTGIGLAAVCAVRGYRCIIVMPDSMSRERMQLMRAYGAEIVLTPGRLGMSGAAAKAEEIHAATPGSIVAGQFDNPANPRAHYEGTGPEIWTDAAGAVDVFVAGVGTGGTLSGTGKYLKEKDPGVRIVAVEPAASPLLSGGKAAPHGLQGIGADFIPANYDAAVTDEIIRVTEEDAFATARLLAKREGLLCGITSGAALWAAGKIAARPEYAGKNIVVLLPDTGSRYLSGPLFAQE